MSGSVAVHCLPFGRLPDGRDVEVYALSREGGFAVRVMTYGSTIVSLHAPDRAGRIGDVVLGFDTLDGYLAHQPYFGGTIGRYANRIRDGRFELDGVVYRLACNNGPNHLHGGIAGFDKRLWTARITDEGEVAMRYSSGDGEEGYPGRVEAQATYALTDDCELTISYRAVCDRRTIVNLTNHAYFNLAAADDVLDHVFELPAAHFLPVDETFIPTGEFRSVEGTPMDFRSPAALRRRIARADEQLRIAGGYDHTWLVPRGDGALGLAARVLEPITGRMLTVRTTQPGVQFYSGNQLDGSIVGKFGRRYARHGGFCLEPHHFPDSPNRPEFPSTILAPGQRYEHTIVYRFDRCA